MNKINNNRETLQRIARYLMLHASHSPYIGLLNGKMGIVIFFYHYGRLTQKKIYEDFAGELLEEIYSEIYRDYIKNFGFGLCGIGWGINYIIRNGFVKADPDEVLEVMDAGIFEMDLRIVKDNSLETGFIGYAQYIIGRHINRKKIYNGIERKYINDLIVRLENNIPENPQNQLVIEKLQAILKGKDIMDNHNLIFDIIEDLKFNRKKIFETINRPLGIRDNGFAGIGLKLIYDEKKESFYF